MTQASVPREEEEEDPFAKTRMSLGEHLEELRKRLLRGFLAIGIAFVLAWTWRDQVTEIVTRPYDWAMGKLEVHYGAEADEILAADPSKKRTDLFETDDPNDRRLRGFDKRLIGIKAGEGFMFQLKISLYAAITFGAPVLLWQMWAFISAGLYKKEQRAVLRYFPLSLVAFAVGVLFGYFVIVPYGMYYLGQSVSIAVGLQNVTFEYFLTFLSGLCLAFGVVFQLPLVLTFLGSTGMVEPAAMAKYRGHFVVAAFVIAAILTPPDPFTQFLMAVPLVVLYEIGIWSARLAIRRRAAAA